MAKRGMSVEKQKCWIDAIGKENRLRLKWFVKNEEKLVKCVEQPASRAVPQEILKEMNANRQKRYQTAERFPNIHIDDAPPREFDERAITHVMKPIDSAVVKLIYSGTQKDGRINYIHERTKLIPEKRYYYPEVNSFRYGWNMWDNAKTRVNLGHGRQQVIKNSFYRRRGCARDPDWYREPARLSPTVCGS